MKRLRRRTPLRRATMKKRRNPLAVFRDARKAKRAADEFERCYHSEERVRWIQRLPSVVSGKGPCENAHVTPPAGLPTGIGRKADYEWIVPLTPGEHRELHRLGEKTFQAKYGVNLAGKAAEIQKRWERIEEVS